jgi:hypothetical protein
MSFFVDLKSLSLKSFHENEKNLFIPKKVANGGKGKSSKEILKIESRFEKTLPFYLVKGVRGARGYSPLLFSARRKTWEDQYSVTSTFIF